MKLVFMGTPQAAVPALDRLADDGHEIAAVYSQPDRPSGRGQKLTPPPVKARALELGIPVFQPEKIRTDEAAAEFRGHAADAAIVVAYGRILPDAFLNAYSNGAINVHFSLLPKYRGAAPVNWAIVNGERETGVTTMQMDAGLDTGDILLQESVPILDNETAPELMTRLAELGASLLSRTLERLSTITPQPQDGGLLSLAPIMRREEGKIDWELPAVEIERRIRGFQPFPGSYTTFRGERFTLWAGEPRDIDPESGVAGEIVSVGRDEIIIKCGGASALALIEGQSQGKRRMPVRDIINGMHPAAGETFGGQ